jgi:hypothetical protein
MIPYDDLVASLQRWRSKQGLPSLTPATSTSAPPPVAPLPSTGYGAAAQADVGGVTSVNNSYGMYEQDTPSPEGKDRGDERTGELDLDTADVVED